MDPSSRPLRQPSSIPRPTVSTNVNKFESDQSSGSVAVSTPDALDFYRQHSFPRKPYGALSPSTSDIARSFESTPQRSASSPPINPSPTFIPGGMQRSSIKDLVARFNQGGNVQENVRPNVPPQNIKVPHTPAKLQKPRRPSVPTNSSRQDRRGSSTIPTIDPKASSFEGFPNTQQAERPLQSKSTASLTSPVDQQRMPLFGEVMASPEQWTNPGYGIPRRKDRRGSEGSMHHPNPMFHTRSVSDLDPTPSSPSLWNSLESYQNGAPPQSPHQRSRSDTSGLPLDGTHQAQSRIPLKFSNTAIPSTDSLNSHHGTPRRPFTPPELLSPRKYEMVKTPGGGQRLKAIITAPAPKKSPPLRSSRPRQDISDASIAHARPKTPDYIQSGSPTRSRDRNISGISPEKRTHLNIGGMDFATRRESIRNAVRKSSDQGLRRERIANALEPDIALGQQDGSAIEDDLEQNDDQKTQSESQGPGHEQHGRRLKLDVKDIEQASAGEISTATTEFEEDSTPPMPGNFPHTDTPDTSAASGYFHQNSKTDQQDDQQTQNASPEINRQAIRQRSVLSQVLEMRKRSTQHLSHLGSFEGLPSENDDSETIQIMLGDTLMLSRAESQGLQNLQDQSGFARDDDSPTLPQDRTTLTPSASWTSQSNDRTSQSGYLTLDSDAYSVIHKILDQYRDSGIISPSMVQEFQQHIVDTDQDLVTDNDEDSMSKVARLALEELIRDHVHLSNLQHEGVDLSDVGTNSISPLVQQNKFPPPPGTLQREFRGYDGSRRFEGASNGSNVQPPATSEVQDFVPQPPPKDRPQTPQATAGSEAIAIPQVFNRNSNQSSSTLSEQPVLPEIQTTNGGLGLAYGPHAIQTNALPIPHIQHPPPAMPVASEQTRSASPRQKMDQPSSMTSDTPQSDGTRPVSAPRATTPTPISQDTPATSISQRSQEDVSRHVSFDASSQNLSAEQKRLNKRKQIIKELVDTEYSYNQDMKVVEDIYMGTASAVDSMSADDRRVLFGNSVDVVKFSESFLDALKSAVSAVYTIPRNSRWFLNKKNSFSTTNSRSAEQPSTVPETINDDNDRMTSIGEAFCKNMSQMERVYGDYLKNHDYANQRLAKLQNISQVSIWLNECHTYASDITSAWDLDSLLVKPVQRILKYPLLLKALLEVTPENHPDYTALNMAAKQMLDVSQRINESKKRVELLDQVVNHKQKEFDVTLGLSKAFGRRTEKLRQQVGLSDAVEDPDYKAIAAKFGGQFFQLQVVMRDVEMYKKSVEEFMAQFNRYIEGFEEFIDVGMSGSPEIESKWRRFAMIIREMSAIAWVDHEAAVRKSCIDPMVALLKMHEGPQKLMAKRKKRLVEYAKYRTLKDRGEKPDKKTIEQGEQFIALNDTLKDELPKLFSLTAKLVEACLKNFVGIQMQWHTTWQRKIRPILENEPIPSGWEEIGDAFKRDFSYTEANVLSLGICNGSILADSSNFLTPSTTNDPSKASSTVASSRRTTGASEHSPVKPQFVHAQTFPYDPSRSSAEQQRNGAAQARQRANSATSSQGGQQWPMSSTTPLSNRTPTAATFPRRPTDTASSASQTRYSTDSTSMQRPVSSSTYYSVSQGAQTTSNGLNQQTPPMRGSGVFNSAMPMTDSPGSSRPVSPPPPQANGGQQEYKVLFLAASLFEFNIDRARKEAGYPYLTYVPGEVFDVIDEKGELWLAKNQDDPTNMIGWIWEKHFAKLISDDS